MEAKRKNVRQKAGKKESFLAGALHEISHLNLVTRIVRILSLVILAGIIAHVLRLKRAL
jgi:hypothetical protein